ncbi:MAG: beta-N-acetylhexosaminidase [Chloroflexi bacterium]|nr:beta-N-acetylhexosaminidase [Chloroflexota bacterium]
MTEMTLEQQLGQMLLVGFEGLEAPDYILDWITSGRIGGVILFGRNVESPEQVAALTQTLHETARQAGRPPLLIGIDQEGGTVARLREGFTESPGALALGAANDLQLAEDVSAMLARELRALGINWDYAPVVDLTHDIANPTVGTRSPGSDRDRVSQIVSAEIRGFQNENVAASAKHFPGLGNTPVDTHVALAVINGSLDYLWEQDLVPFRAAVASGVASVMVSHVKFTALDPDHPATLSPVIVQRLLREEMGYDGAACTDSMEMKAISDHYGAGESAVLAALAGIDLLLFSHYRQNQENASNALLEAAQSGRLPQTVIDTANDRIAALKADYAIVEPPDLSIIRQPEHLALAQRAARAGMVLPRNDNDIFPIRPEKPHVVLVEFGSLLDSEAMERGGLASFARMVSARAPEMPCVSLKAADPPPAVLARARELAEYADLLVLATRSAHLMPEQLEMAKNLLALSKRSILICLRNPFDAGVLTGMDAILCTCGDSTPSLQAAADALFGDFVPTGRLPVEVSL